MTWSESIGIGITTAVVAFFASIGVQALYFEWRLAEDDQTILALQFAGMLGAFAFSIVLSRIIGAQGFGHTAAYALGGVFLIAIAVAAFGLLIPDQAPRLRNEPLTLEVELRCPPDWTLDYRLLGLTSLSTTSNFSSTHEMGWAKFDKARREADGRWIIPLSIELESSREFRVMKVELERGHVIRFRAPIPGHPAESNQHWGEWTTKEFRGTVPDGFSVRARVQRKSVLEEAWKAEYAATLAARKEELNRLGKSDPLVRWLPFFDPLKTIRPENDPALPPALEVIRTKLTEFPAALRSPDRIVVRRALTALLQLDPIPPELAPDVEYAGRRTLDFVAYARSRALPQAPGFPDFQAEGEAYDFFLQWRLAAKKLAVSGTATVEEIAAAVKDERSGALANLGAAARETLAKTGKGGA